MSEYFDLCGVGFGPANLALAVAMKELNNRKQVPPSYHFLEKRAQFEWHPGMLIDDAEMQISFLKDLATLRDPTSEFTFLNYLRCSGSLDSFANLRRFFPSRVEYHAYLKWAAGKFDKYVSYGATARNVELSHPGTDKAVLEVTYERDGNIYTAQCKNLAVGVGGKPSLPKCLTGITSPKIVHSSNFLPAIKAQFPDRSREYDFLVVGGGQSSAEMFCYLTSHFPNSKIRLTFRRFALKPSDDSEFVNEIFSPDHVDFFYKSSPAFREEFLNDYSNTNYSAIDPPMISRIYADLYRDKWHGDGRLSVSRYRELTEVNNTSDKISVRQRNCITGDDENSSIDGLFLGTGYDFQENLNILNNVKEYFKRDNDNNYIFSRNYSLTPVHSDLGVNIFTHGATESSHGLSSTLLSMLPYRSAEIAGSIFSLADRRKPYISSPEVENA